MAQHGEVVAKFRLRFGWRVGVSIAYLSWRAGLISKQRCDKWIRKWIKVRVEFVPHA